MSFELLPTIPVQGVPTFAAPAGALASRFDMSGTYIDRLYVSNGPGNSGNLAGLQISDTVASQYVMQETAGTIAYDTGTLGENGTYVAPFTLGLGPIISGVTATAVIGNVPGQTPETPPYGLVVLPFTNPPKNAATSAWSIEIVIYQGASLGDLGPGNIVCNDDLGTGTAGFSIYVNSSNEFVFSFGSSGGRNIITSPIATNQDKVWLLNAVYDGGSIYLYVNGALQGAVAASGYYVNSGNYITFSRALTNPTQNIILGYYQCGGFYAYALSAAQIAEHYAAISSGFPGTGLWSDVQAITVDIGGTLAGEANAIRPGQNTSFSLNNETLTVNSFLTLEAAGTVENSAMIALNISGGGASVSSAGQVGTLNVPGISFSGTNIDFITTAGGISGAIVGGNTLALSASSTGSSGIVFNGTLYGTQAAGANISLSGAGGVLTISAPSTGGSGYSPGTPPRVVQFTANNSGGNSATFSSSPTSGNYLIALTSNPNSGTSAGSGWTNIGSNGTGGEWTGIFKKIAGSSESVVQSPISGIGTVGVIGIWEYNGVNPTQPIAGLYSNPETTGITGGGVNFGYIGTNCSAICLSAAIPGGGTIHSVMNGGTIDGYSPASGTRYYAAGHSDLSSTNIVGSSLILNASASAKSIAAMLVT